MMRTAFVHHVRGLALMLLLPPNPSERQHQHAFAHSNSWPLLSMPQNADPPFCQLPQRLFCGRQQAADPGKGNGTFSGHSTWAHVAHARTAV